MVTTTGLITVAGFAAASVNIAIVAALTPDDFNSVASAVVFRLVTTADRDAAATTFAPIETSPEAATVASVWGAALGSTSEMATTTMATITTHRRHITGDCFRGPTGGGKAVCTIVAVGVAAVAAP